MKWMVLMQASIVTVSLGSGNSARAGASCRIHDETLLGVTADGLVVSHVSKESGESDETPWQIKVTHGAKPICRLEGTSEDGAAFSVTGDKERCAKLAGDRDLKKISVAQLVARIRQRVSAPPAPVRLPPGFALPPAKTETGDGPDGYRGGVPIAQRITVDGITVATIEYGASTWALAGYVVPGFDGVLLRVTSLLDSPEAKLDANTGCTDYYDGYIPLVNTTIASARARAMARKQKAKR